MNSGGYSDHTPSRTAGSPTSTAPLRPLRPLRRHLLQHFLRHRLQLLASQLHHLLLGNFRNGLLVQDVWDLEPRDPRGAGENLGKISGDMGDMGDMGDESPTVRDMFDECCLQ